MERPPPGPAMTFDLFLAGVVALFGLLGLLSGALGQLRHWLGLALAALAARPLAARLAPRAAASLGLSTAAADVALSGVFFAVLYVIGMLAARRLLMKLFHDRQNGAGDRAFGFGLGAAKGAALLFVLLSLLIFFEGPLTKALGTPPAPVRESRAVAFVRRHDLFDAVPVAASTRLQKLIEAAKSPGGLQDMGGEPELRRMLEDPRLKAALQDGDLSRALKSADLSSLRGDPRLKALLDDPRLAEPAAGPPPR